MKILRTNCSFRLIDCRGFFLAICGLVVVLFLLIFPAPVQAQALHQAFGVSIKIPSLALPGTVIARHYIPLSTVCGPSSSRCEIFKNSSYPNGGNISSIIPLVVTNVSGISAQILFNGKPTGKYGDAPPIVLTRLLSPVEIQLVRDNRPLESGSLKGSYVPPDYFRFGLGGDSINREMWVNLSGDIFVIPGTCSVPNQTVNLPPALLAGFNGKGSTSGKHAFNINLENCPPGFNRVGHLLTAVGGQVAGIPGALMPTAGSTATGVAIKLTDASSAPATFGTSLPVTSYNKATGGAATVPMNASYVQTGTAAVSAGTVKGAVQVLLDYQ